LPPTLRRGDGGSADRGSKDPRRATRSKMPIDSAILARIAVEDVTRSKVGFTKNAPTIQKRKKIAQQLAMPQ
jgi:hypothetical protein